MDLNGTINYNHSVDHQTAPSEQNVEPLRLLCNHFGVVRAPDCAQSKIALFPSRCSIRLGPDTNRPLGHDNGDANHSPLPHEGFERGLVRCL